jgi:hypothetical protein
MGSLEHWALHRPALTAAAAVFLAAISMGCTSPLPTQSPTSAPSIATQGPTSPAATPLASEPAAARVDVVNGSRHVIVWITTDIGAAGRDMLPREQASLSLPPGSREAVVEVMEPVDCALLATLHFTSIPATIVLSDDPTSSRYTIQLTPGTSGAPVPRASAQFPGCSG